MNDFKFPSITPKGVVLGVIAVTLFLFVYSVSSSMMEQSSMSSLSSAGMVTPSYPQGQIQKGYGDAPPFAAPDYNMAYNERGYAVSEGFAGKMAPSFVPSPFPSAPALGDAKLVKSSYLSLLVKNMDEAAEGITRIRTQFGGQAGNASFSEYEHGVRTGNVTIWVPTNVFDGAVVEIKKLALRVENDNTNVSDVSAEFVDLTARLKNLKAAEEQFIALIQRSGKLSDVLEVTRELNNTRSQIEQLQGQLDYLSRQINLSSITIALREEASPISGTDEWRPLGVVKEATKKTLLDFTRFIDMLLVFMIRLPMLLLVIAFWGLIMWGLWKAACFLNGRLHRAFPDAVVPPSKPSATTKKGV